MKKLIYFLLAFCLPISAQAAFTGNETPTQYISKLNLLVSGSMPSLVKSFSIADLVDTDDIGLWRTAVDITITNVHCYQTAGTNVVFNINHASARTGTGLDVFTSNVTETSTAGADHNTGFNDATIPANSHVWLDTVIISGTPTEFACNIYYTED